VIRREQSSRGISDFSVRSGVSKSDQKEAKQSRQSCHCEVGCGENDGVDVVAVVEDVDIFRSFVEYEERVVRKDVKWRVWAVSKHRADAQIKNHRGEQTPDLPEIETNLPSHVTGTIVGVSAFVWDIKIVPVRHMSALALEDSFDPHAENEPWFGQKHQVGGDREPVYDPDVDVVGRIRDARVCQCLKQGRHVLDPKS